ncbi:MAG: glycosyltransferase [Flavobacteriales bacterium]|nr:glycosyltransferase [Flavobacteriales bacterium]
MKNQVTLLNGEGVDCHVVEFQYCGRKPLEQRSSMGITIYTIHAPKFLHHFRSLSADLPVFNWFAKRSLKAVSSKHPISPTVVHCYNTFAWEGVAQFVNEWRWPKQPKLTIDFAEDLPSIMREYDYVKRGAGKWLINLRKWDRLQARAVQNADLCIVVTDEAATDYCQRYTVQRSKFLCINNLPNEALINQSKALKQAVNQPFTLLYFGDTSVRRGTDQLIRTASEIRLTIPDYEVVIIGHNNREQATLEKLVATHQCKSFVHLMGFQPEIDLPKYMARSSMGVSPLKRNPHHDTTHANKLFQFMLGGLPLLVSDCIAQANLVRNHNLGAVFEANNDREFIETVVSVWRSQDQYEAWKTNVNSYMEQHTLASDIQPYVELIRRAQ